MTLRVPNVIGSNKIFKTSPEDNQVYLSQGPRGLPEDSPNTQEFWVDSEGTSRSFRGQFSGIVTSSSAFGFVKFKLPHDFSFITSAEMLIIPAATQATRSLDIFTDYGASGEQYNLHSESANFSESLTDGELTLIDVSSTLTLLSAGDYVGILLRNNDATNFLTIGMRFRYN